MDAKARRFTPFVPERSRRLAAAARRLLGLGASFEVRGALGRPAPGAGPVVEITVAARDGARLRLDLVAADAGTPAFVRGPALALTYHAGPGDADPLESPRWGPLLAHLRRRIAAVPPAAAGPLWAEVSAAGALAGVEDWMFHQAPRPGATQPTGLLRLGFRCNQDCAFCWQDRDWEGPPAEVYLAWLDELAALGTEKLIVSGGEPTLSPVLPEVLHRATAVHGLSVVLETNAIQLRRPAILARLRDAGLQEIFVSFHSHLPEVSDALTRAPGTHRGTVAGIEAALGAGLAVRLNCVVEARNAAAVADHARFVAERFAAPYPANPVQGVVYSHPAAYHDDAEFAAGVVSLDAVRPSLLEAIGILQGAGVEVEAVGTCGFPPCLFADAPSVLRWLDPRIIEAPSASGRRYAEACAGCVARPYCLGFRAEYVAAAGFPAVRPFSEATWPLSVPAAAGMPEAPPAEAPAVRRQVTGPAGETGTKGRG